MSSLSLFKQIWLVTKNSLLILLIDIIIMIRILLNIDLLILLIILISLIKIFVPIVLNSFGIYLIINWVKILPSISLSISIFSLQIFLTQIIEILSLRHQLLSQHHLIVVVLSRIRHGIKSIRACHVILFHFHVYLAHAAFSRVHRDLYVLQEVLECFSHYYSIFFHQICFFRISLYLLVNLFELINNVDYELLLQFKFPLRLLNIWMKFLFINGNIIFILCNYFIEFEFGLLHIVQCFICPASFPFFLMLKQLLNSQVVINLDLILSILSFQLIFIWLQIHL